MIAKIYTTEQATENIKQFDKAYAIAEEADTIEELKEAVAIADFEPENNDFNGLKEEVLNYCYACLLDIDKEHPELYEELHKDYQACPVNLGL